LLFKVVKIRWFANVLGGTSLRGRGRGRYITFILNRYICRIHTKGNVKFKYGTDAPKSRLTGEPGGFSFHGRVESVAFW
jgi:hypothetical protein